MKKKAIKKGRLLSLAGLCVLILGFLAFLKREQIEIWYYSNYPPNPLAQKFYDLGITQANLKKLGVQGMESNFGSKYKSTIDDPIILKKFWRNVYKGERTSRYMFSGWYTLSIYVKGHSSPKATIRVNESDALIFGELTEKNRDPVTQKWDLPMVEGINELVGNSIKAEYDRQR